MEPCKLYEKENVVIDFHSHVLPEIDDGSKSAEESLQMLKASSGQGITHMAATPRFDPSETSPEAIPGPAGPSGGTFAGGVAAGVSQAAVGCGGLFF